jgi:hypothetical protein
VRALTFLLRSIGLALAWLFVLSIFAVAGFVYYVVCLPLLGPPLTIMFAILNVSAVVGALYISYRRRRGKTPEQIYESDPFVRSLERIDNRPWPWSALGLGPRPEEPGPPVREDGSRPRGNDRPNAK